MVLLIMTPAIMRALEAAEAIAAEDYGKMPLEPSLADPKAGNPISHRQLIALSKLVKKHVSEIAVWDEAAEKAHPKDYIPTPTTLDALLRNSRVYIAPPPAKKPQTPEYVALMARLRAEEEARAYERMLQPSSSTSDLPGPQTFSQRFPNAQNFSIGSHTASDEDELSYEEVHRQIILIINVLVSVIACAVFIWVAARHWSAPKRLGLSMAGSGAVAIAEVVVYSGYIRRVAEAKRREKKKPEIKEIVKSWVIDRSGDKSGNKVDISLSTAKEKAEERVRYRKAKHR